nr:hypothetical protein [Tanacetum cinerariifolium]
MEYSRDGSYSRGHPHKRDSSPSRDRPRSRYRSHGIEKSYGNTYPSYQTGDKHMYHSHSTGRSSSMKRRRNSESPLSHVLKSGTSKRGHWKSKSKRRKPTDEEDLAAPWSCEEVDPFTPRIRNFKSSRKTRMPYNVKTYDGTGDPEDHVKKFKPQHRYNAGNAYMVSHIQLYPQRDREDMKYVKDPVEIHTIKQKDGESIKDFIKRFKVKTGRMKGAPECMRISGFMHGVNNPKLTKRLNEHVPKTVEEMMIATAAFIREEAVAASKKKVHTSWKSQDQSKRQNSERRSDFRNQSRDGQWRSTRYRSGNYWTCGTLLIRGRRLLDGGDAEHYTRAWMNFMLARSPSPYKDIIGWPGIREIQAVPSTAHEKLKFPMNGEINSCLYQFLYLYLDCLGALWGLPSFILSDMGISFSDIESVLENRS